MACDVIEHIEDDSAALAELRRVASPASRLLVTVPAYQWLWSHHDETHHHHRRYTRRVLVERAGASGWRPLLATYFNTLLLAPIAAVRAIQRVWPPRDRTNYEATPQRLNRVLELPLRAEARAIERGIDLPAGVSVGLVCGPA